MSERVLPRPVGHWYTPHHSTSASVATTEARLMMFPFDLSAPMKIDQTMFEVAIVGGAGEVVRLGYYADDGSYNRPGALIADVGTAAVDGSIGNKTISHAVATLPAGRIWSVGVAQGASGTPPAIRAAVVFHSRITLPTLAGVFQNTVCVDGITGALPASLVGSTFLTINFAIAIGMRIA